MQSHHPRRKAGVSPGWAVRLAAKGWLGRALAGQACAGIGKVKDAVWRLSFVSLQFSGGRRPALRLSSLGRQMDGSEPGARGTHEASDHSLLRRLRSGSSDAATQLYLRYAHRLHALARAKTSADLARQVDSDEIVQSVFGSFFRGAQAGYYDVPAGEELWKLFLVIALNKIRAKGAYHRAAKRDLRKTSSAETLDDLRESTTDDADALMVLQLTIDESLDKMPEQHRQILLLRVEGHEIEEIAQSVGRSKRTVERILQEVRASLSDTLQEK
jgi:RNA polymerase sigma-70 factor (ECF subfamily)